MTLSTALLHQAATVLEEAAPHSNRVACWIARAALESAVEDRLNRMHAPAPNATMRSKLTVLEVAAGEGSPIPAQAEYAWSGLTRACHHHAFELSPTLGEVRHLISVVEELIDHSPTDDPGSHE